MSNPWSGHVAKGIKSKKRPRIFWNVFFSIVIAVILLVMLIFAYQIASECLKYDSVQIFVEYENGYLITNVDSFEIHEYDKQEIEISKLLGMVDTGEKITLTISRISGELLEVKYLNDVVYKKVPTPIIPTIVAMFLLVFPMLGFCIFMLIVTNIKNPSKRIDKIQSKFLLRFYE